MKITEPTVGAPCWVELGTSDPEAAKAVYCELFGWRAETDPNPEAGGYTVFLLGEAPVGGLSPSATTETTVAWTVSFATADVDASVRAAGEAGGRVLMQPADVLDLGRFAVAADPQGAGFALWQARTFPGFGLVNEPGTVGWVELATRNTTGAIDFYTGLFGWTVSPGEMYTQFGIAGQDFGGMTDMTEQFPADVPPYWMPYFAVANVDLTAERAVALGVDVVLAPTDVPGGPRLAVLKDKQGAVFGIHIAGMEG